MIVLCLITCLFLTVSGVSATTMDDNSTQVEISTDTDLVSVDTTTDNIVVLNESSQSAESVLGSASDSELLSNDGKEHSFSEINLEFGRTYYLNGNTYVSTENKGITLVSNIVIDGQGAIFNMDNKQFGFTGTDVYNITIKNINFKNLYSNPSEGGIDNAHSFLKFIRCSNITIDDCTFTNAYSRIWSGAILFYGDCKYNTINNCIFSNCNGSNLTQFGAGGGITFEGGTTYSKVTNCNFYDSESGCGGGLTFHNSNNNWNLVENCKFIRCHSIAFSGAAIECYSKNTNITNCDFINCTVKTSNVMPQGSGVLCFWKGAVNGTVSNCRFYNNTCVAHGAAICSYSSDNEKIYVENCVFEGNKAGENGGAVYFNGKNSVISNCTFFNNSAKNGGAVYFNANNCNISNSSFKNNSALSSGGAIYSSAYNSKVINSTFQGNRAPDGGNFKSTSDIEFIGLVFDSLYLSSTSDKSVLEGFGTTPDKATYWDGQDIWKFLSVEKGQTTISTHTNN